MKKKAAKPSRPKKSLRQSPAKQPDQARLFPIVGVGASAGGFEAFAELLKNIPDAPGLAIVLVQHLDPSHGSMLSDILGRTTKLPVAEVKDGVVVTPGRVYVIPANTNMVIENGILRLGARVLIRGQHLPIDQFFQSLADERGNQAIGVILSGTASDGTEGCRAIKAAGGITFAQDEDSAKFSGMPRNATTAGCIDFVMNPHDIASELIRIVQHPYVSQLPPSEDKGVALGNGRDRDELLHLLSEVSGVDFSNYKQTTLQRRIRRRMVVHRLEKLHEYLKYVKDHRSELDELYRDILIHVTGFFRDPSAFEALRSSVFPALLKNRNLNETPLRIWVPGCSTGEEVYSIAIVLLEYIWEQKGSSAASLSSQLIQICATDISEPSLNRGRAGLYGEAAVADVSPERLARFFIKADGGYQINKALREVCIFANQNVAKDPPFSNLDLISCRNVLIYLGPVLQKRVIPALHYALRPDGYLLLGGSESLGTFADHFLLIDKKHKVYQKKPTAARLVGYFAVPSQLPPRRAVENQATRLLPSGPSTLESQSERILMSRFTPPSIVVNDQMEVVHVRGRTGAYLEVAEGHPSVSLSKMAREGLLVELHAAINKARKTNSPVKAENIQVKSNGDIKEVNLTITPIQLDSTPHKFFLVVFHDVPENRALTGKRPQSMSNKAQSATNREMERLRRENSEVKQQLRTLLEDHEITSEEFKSANEEVLSANEELQSTNEELETAKEELQSGNEELTTLNEELHIRNAELSMANNDLTNLLNNVNIPLVMIGTDFRVRRFTPPAEKLLNLIPTDIGRRIGEIRPNITFDDLETMVREVVDNATVQQREVQDKEGRWHLLRGRPYKTWDNKIEGAVVTFLDIDSLKRTLDQTRLYATALIENAREAIVILDSKMRVTTGNSGFYRIIGVSAEKAEGKPVFELGDGNWNSTILREFLNKITSDNVRAENHRMRAIFTKDGAKSVLLNARRVKSHDGDASILLSIAEVPGIEN
ncbi:MAG TPA: chemotaxis protein CheB [Terriglobales bacterium]